MTPEEELIVKRLKATFADVDEMEKGFDIVTKILALREAEIEQHKALCVRAADALEDSRGPGWKRALIAELRKAARE